jgi:hypothetical protein
MRFKIKGDSKGKRNDTIENISTVYIGEDNYFITEEYLSEGIENFPRIRLDKIQAIASHEGIDVDLTEILTDFEDFDVFDTYFLKNNLMYGHGNGKISRLAKNLINLIKKGVQISNKYTFIKPKDFYLPIPTFLEIESNEVIIGILYGERLCQEEFENRLRRYKDKEKIWFMPEGITYPKEGWKKYPLDYPEPYPMIELIEMILKHIYDLNLWTRSYEDLYFEDYQWDSITEQFKPYMTQNFNNFNELFKIFQNYFLSEIGGSLEGSEILKGILQGNLPDENDYFGFDGKDMELFFRNGIAPISYHAIINNEYDQPTLFWEKIPKMFEKDWFTSLSPPLIDPITKEHRRTIVLSHYDESYGKSIFFSTFLIDEKLDKEQILEIFKQTRYLYETEKKQKDFILF